MCRIFAPLPAAILCLYAQAPDTRMTASLAVPLLAAAIALAEERNIAVGLTTGGTVIEAIEARGPSAKLPVIMHIGGLDGKQNNEVLSHVEAVRRKPARRRDYHLIAIPHANPARAKLAFPPAGIAYREN